MIHTLKGFGIVNKAEIDIFLELSCFFDDPADVGNLSLIPLPFLEPAFFLFFFLHQFLDFNGKTLAVSLSLNFASPIAPQ